MLKKQKVKKTSNMKITFVLPEDSSWEQVSVVGDFNDWDPSKNKLIKRNNRTFSSSVTLPQGQKYHFRYLTSSGEWINDDSADGYEAGSYGSDNCVLLT